MVSLAGVALSVVLVVVFFVLSGNAEASNSTVAGIVTARATDATSILVRMPYTGDDNADNIYTVQWKPCADAFYQPADTIAGAHSPSPFTATITGLTENTCYTIKAMYNDVDGVTHTNPQEIKITSTWDNTLLHNSNRFSTSVKWNESGGWGLPETKYGQTDCGTCHIPRATNVKGVAGNVTAPNGTDQFPGQQGGVNIEFRSMTTPYGFGDDASGHAISTKVCEYCHSRNKYHNYDTSNNTGGFNHNNNVDCTVCHSHSRGFYYTSDCDSCHGNPPTAATAGGPNGLASSPYRTGSQTAGAHQRHATSGALNYECSTCHNSYVMPQESSVKSGFGDISISFSTFELTAGSYGGQSNVSYNNVLGDGTKSCANIYCHGSTMVPNGGTNTTPVWDDPATAACGTCHGDTATNPPIRGSHRTHTMAVEWSYAPNNVEPFNNYIYGRNMTCTVCHNNYTSNHVNGQADWAFDTATYPWLSGSLYKGLGSGSASPVPGTYGQCSNTYCHSVVQTGTGGPLTGLPGEYKTPTWGNRTSGNCGSCHAVDNGHAYWAGLLTLPPEISTGSHTKHLEALGLSAGLGATPGGPGRCTVCHNYVGSDGLLGCASVCHNRGDLHVNHQIEVKFPPTTYGSSAVYNGTPQPGTGFSTCSNTYCHGNFAGSGLNATPTWGNVESGTCGTCHAGTSGRSNSGDGTNQSHYIHVDRHGYACDLCHYDTTTGSALKSSSYHVNRAADWHFNPNDPRTAAGLYSDTRTNPITWSAKGSRTPPRTINGTAQADGNCANITCHSSVQGVNNPTDPPVYYVDPYNVYEPKWGSGSLDCAGCHKAGNHGGSNRIDTGSHLKHLTTFGYSITSNFGACQICHYIDDGSGNPCRPCHDYDGYRRRYVNHGNNLIEVTFLTSFVGAGATYSGDPAPRTPYGSCSNVYCHSIGRTTVATGNLPAAYNGSIYADPAWGSSLGCNGCHGRTTSNGMPDYTSDGVGTANANSHQAHVSLSGYGCQECHYGTTNDGVTIANHDAHINKATNEVSFNSSGTYNGSTKKCSNTYCHSDGTFLSSGTIPANISPAWGGSITTCTGCHGNPPAYAQGQLKNNSHDKHTAYTCNTCHLSTTTTGNTITNRANHANKVYDVQADPSVVVGGNPVSFTYTFNAIMSRCESVSCHSGTEIYWASLAPGANINYTFGSWCYEVNFTGKALGGTPPYTYEWDFGDGQTGTGSALTHRYPGAGPYTVTLTVRDANLVAATTQKSVTPQNANQPAVANYTVSVSGMTVTLTDLSYDPDYNQCGHSGPGIISILWGDNTNTTTTNFMMTDTPSHHIFTHTYANPGNYWIYHSVRDNTCQINWCNWSCSDCQTGTMITVPQ